MVVDLFNAGGLAGTEGTAMKRRCVGRDSGGEISRRAVAKCYCAELFRSD